MIGRKASQIAMKPVEWVWTNRLAKGVFSGFDGDPERGKSQVLAVMAAHVSTGTPWPDGSPCPQGGVIIVGAEDSWEATVKPRLVAAGADCSRVRLVSTVPCEDGAERLLSIPEDLDLIERLVHEDDALLIGFDPLSAFLSDSINANAEHDVRRALTPLIEMLERTGCACIALRHLNKQDRVANALYRGLGSIGFNALARTVLGVVKDPDEPDSYIFTVLKNNLALKPRSQRYRIEPVNVTEGGQTIPTSRIAWGEETDQAADELMIAFPRPRPRQNASDFLRESLADGPVDSKQLFEMAESMGIAPATLKRAKKEIGVIARKAGFTGRWTWELPQHEGDQIADARRGSNRESDPADSYSNPEGDHTTKLILFDDRTPRRGSNRVYEPLQCPACSTPCISTGNGLVCPRCAVED